MNIRINQQQLKSICDVLADTSKGLTKTELTHKLRQGNIEVLDDGFRSNGMSYQIGLNKRDWLYNCIAADLNANHDIKRIINFIEVAMDPVSYTAMDKRDKYSYIADELNKVLLLTGLQLRNDGKIQVAVKASTLDEVDRRVNSLYKQLYNRAIHSEVTKYCIKDYLRKDYYDAVFEAAKGLAQRLREISGLSTDGGTLFQTAFSRKDPYVFFNSLQTDSEISEYIGVRELLESVFHLVRNPAAHTPKVNWHIEESKALDILTLISFAHKYLDECHRVPHL